MDVKELIVSVTDVVVDPTVLVTVDVTEPIIDPISIENEIVIKKKKSCNIFIALLIYYIIGIQFSNIEILDAAFHAT